MLSAVLFLSYNANNSLLIRAKYTVGRVKNGRVEFNKKLYKTQKRHRERRRENRLTLHLVGFIIEPRQKVPWEVDMENVKGRFRFNISTESKKCEVREFTKREEGLHALTHAIGAVLSIFALVLLILKAQTADGVTLFSVTVYGVSLVILYSASFAYHTSLSIVGEAKPCRIRDFFMKCDHSMIFFLILGTYTPACLISLRGAVGFFVFASVAIACILGIILNFISVERFYKLSQLLYLLTGWSIVAFIYPFYEVIGAGGISALVLGGVLYTVGVIFYNLRNIRNMHIVWHIFVLGGSFMHFITVYFFCV